MTIWTRKTGLVAATILGVASLSSCKLKNGTENSDTLSTNSIPPEFLGVVSPNGKETLLLWLSLLRLDNKKAALDDNVVACVYKKHVFENLSKKPAKEVEKLIQSSERLTNKRVTFTHLIDTMNKRVHEGKSFYGALSALGLVGGSSAAIKGFPDEVFTVYDPKLKRNVFKVSDPMGRIVKFDYKGVAAFLEEFREAAIPRILGAWDQAVHRIPDQATKKITSAKFTDEIFLKMMNNPNLKQLDVVFEDGVKRAVNLEKVQHVLAELKNSDSFKDYSMEVRIFQYKTKDLLAQLERSRINPATLDEIVESEMLAHRIFRNRLKGNSFLLGTSVVMIGAAGVALKLALPKNVIQRDFSSMFASNKKLTFDDVQNMVAGALENKNNGTVNCPSSEEAWKNIVRYRYNNKNEIVKAEK